MSGRPARVLETCVQEDISLWVLLHEGKQLRVPQAAALHNAREGSMNREHCPVEELLHRATPGVRGECFPDLTHRDDEKKWPALQVKFH